jgi:hypothetical protein
MRASEHTVLITGGAGFIGSHAVEHFIKLGRQVINLDLLTYARNLDNLTAVAGHKRHIFIHGEICGRRLVAGPLGEHRPSVMLNIAAEPRRSLDRRCLDLHRNQRDRSIFACSTRHWPTGDASAPPRASVVCLEEIAFHKGWMTAQKLRERAETKRNSDYGRHLEDIGSADN